MTYRSLTYPRVAATAAVALPSSSAAYVLVARRRAAPMRLCCRVDVDGALLFTHCECHALRAPRAVPISRCRTRKRWPRRARRGQARPLPRRDDADAHVLVVRRRSAPNPGIRTRQRHRAVPSNAAQRDSPTTLLRRCSSRGAMMVTTTASSTVLGSSSACSIVQPKLNSRPGWQSTVTLSAPRTCDHVAVNRESTGAKRGSSIRRVTSVGADALGSTRRIRRPQAAESDEQHESGAAPHLIGHYNL